MLAGLALLPLVLLFRRRARPSWIFVLCLLALSSLTVTSCGGSSSSKRDMGGLTDLAGELSDGAVSSTDLAPPADMTPPLDMTPPPIPTGTYPFTVTATAGSLTSTQSLSLTIN
jgi:hypothetical protein